jgi:hypothetical protein
VHRWLRHSSLEALAAVNWSIDRYACYLQGWEIVGLIITGSV